MTDNKKTVKGNIFDTTAQTVAQAKVEVESSINYKDTWVRESGKQPGLMLEVLNMGRVPFKKILSN